MPDPPSIAKLASFAIVAIAGYHLGSLPFARWVAAARGVDLLTSGDRNPGAANAWRQLGGRAGFVILAADAGKAVAAVVIGLELLGWWGGCAGLLGAMIGHAWPLGSGFRGGRSIACLVGGGAALAPIPFLISLGLFAALISLTGVMRAVAIGILAYPISFALVGPDRLRLVGIGFVYLLVAVIWVVRTRPVTPGERVG